MKSMGRRQAKRRQRRRRRLLSESEFRKVIEKSKTIDYDRRAWKERRQSPRRKGK
jgi:hypothetical protein